MTRKKRCGYTLEFRHPIIHILNLATWTEIVLLFYENIQNFNLNLDCLSTLRSFWKTFWAKRYVKSKIVFPPQLERNTKYDWPMYNPYFKPCKCRLRILGENLEITKNIYKKTIDKSVPSFDSKNGNSILVEIFSDFLTFRQSLLSPQVKHNWLLLAETLFSKQHVT